MVTKDNKLDSDSYAVSLKKSSLLKCLVCSSVLVKLRDLHARPGKTLAGECTQGSTTASLT